MVYGIEYMVHGSFLKSGAVMLSQPTGDIDDESALDEHLEEVPTEEMPE